MGRHARRSCRFDDLFYVRMTSDDDRDIARDFTPPKYLDFLRAECRRAEQAMSLEDVRHVDAVAARGLHARSFICKKRSR